MRSAVKRTMVVLGEYHSNLALAIYRRETSHTASNKFKNSSTTPLAVCGTKVSNVGLG